MSELIAAGYDNWKLAGPPEREERSTGKYYVPLSVIVEIEDQGDDEFNADFASRLVEAQEAAVADINKAIEMSGIKVSVVSAEDLTSTNWDGPL